MARRREFTRDTAAEIMKRVKVETGFRCEHCNGVVTKGEIHHKDQDAMQVDKRRKLTAADGEFLCEPCHDIETAKQAPVLAKVKRQEAKHLGVQTTTKNPIATPAPRPKDPKPSKVTTDKTALGIGGAYRFGVFYPDEPRRTKQETAS